MADGGAELAELLPSRRVRLERALSTEWQSCRALSRIVGVTPQSLGPLLVELRAEGRVERRGLGVVGAPYEWRLVSLEVAGVG